MSFESRHAQRVAAWEQEGREQFRATVGDTYTRSQGSPSAKDDVLAALERYADQRKPLPTRLGTLYGGEKTDHFLRVTVDDALRRVVNLTIEGVKKITSRRKHQ